MVELPEVKEPKLRAVPRSGNAYSVLMATRNALRGQYTKDEIEVIMIEAKSDGYDHLIQTCMEYVEIDVE